MRALINPLNNLKRFDPCQSFIREDGLMHGQGNDVMPKITKIHEVYHSDQRERDEWSLVCHPCGRRYIIFETHLLNPASDLPINSRKKEIAVQAILAQNNELSHKLKAVLNQ